MTYRADQQPQSDASRCGCQEHRALLDAIRLRDAHEAARLMGEHLMQLESQLQFTQGGGDMPDLLALFGSEPTGLAAH
jgi:DNA-binding GntR family transcriptional regulator